MAEISTTLYNTAHCDEHSMPKVVRICNGSIHLILTPIMHFRLLLSATMLSSKILIGLGLGKYSPAFPGRSVQAMGLC